ncbi:MAG: hypothetical protein Q6354_08295, partial [Candidatus Brocadiales bacterium]|nr:hypothetical protein [Candidatus Brocadiales bacterium]
MRELFDRAGQYLQEGGTDLIFSCHLLFSAFFFSNFFLFGQIFIGGMDMLHLTFPMWILAKRDFLQGELGLWNPFISCGTSASMCVACHVYALDLWPLFLVPERYFFYAITFSLFVKLWLVGIFSYLLFHQELGDKKWAFFSSTVFQLCGYTIWAVINYDNLSFLLYSTIALYLVWTWHQRVVYKSYVYLTLALVMTLISSGTVYGLYAMVPIAILSLYRWLSQADGRPSLPAFFVFVISFVTAGLICMVRLLPFWSEIHSTSRVPTLPSANFIDFSILGLRLSYPEIFGVQLESLHPILFAISPVFKGIQTEDWMLHYFGTLPLLLALWAVLSLHGGKRFGFWVVYVVVAFALVVGIEPFDTLFRILLHPFYHYVSLQIFLPVGFCMLVGYAARHLERETGGNFLIEDWPIGGLVFLIMALLLYAAVTWIPNLQFGLRPVQLCIYLSLALAGGMYVVYHYRRDLFVYVLSALLILVPLWAFLVFRSNTVVSHLIVFNRTFLSHLVMISVSVFMLFLLYLAVLLISVGVVRSRTFLLKMGLPLCAIFLFVLLYPWGGALRESWPKEGDLVLASLGFARFIVVSSFLVTVFILVREKKFMPTYLFPFFFSVMIVDMLAYSKVHSHVAANPFYQWSTPYPPPAPFTGEDGKKIELKELELEKFRVSNPNSMLRLPFYTYLYGGGEKLSSLYSVFGIRSYGGYINAVSPRYERFVKSLVPTASHGPTFTIVQGFWANIKDERFLDLCAVRYDYDTSSAQLRIRPNTLSRVMLFKSYEIISDDG